MQKPKKKRTLRVSGFILNAIQYVFNWDIITIFVYSALTLGPMLGESCDTVKLCMEGTQCAADGTCRCRHGFYDDNKEAVGGTCRSSE